MNLNARNRVGFSRRKFIGNTGIVAGALLSAVPAILASDLSSDNKTKPGHIVINPEFELSTLPNFCSHEHWGSIGSIGYEKGLGFRCDTVAGAQPTSPTTIWDLLLDPYLAGAMQQSGRNPNGAALEAGYSSQKEWWLANPSQALNGFKKDFSSSALLGTFHCIRRGIENLYGTEIANFDLDKWQYVDNEIKKHYSDMFPWIQTAMGKNHFSRLIRPVHPEFYLKYETLESKKQESTFTDTILRIDLFMDMWKEKSPRRAFLAETTGIDPINAKSWREFIEAIFDLAAKNHTTGIKQLQAYIRNLDFQPRNDNEVKFRGQLTTDEVNIFTDWVMHECCKQANDRRWPHQVHVGTNNLRGSSPLPLEDISKRYPRMNIVMLHCWPFLKEAAHLARNSPNLYIDTCWLPVLNPNFLREALSICLNYVPYNKIMMAHDSTSIEMAAGSSNYTRELLTEMLLKQRSLISDRDLRLVALDLLHNNAVRIYGVGSEVVLD